MLGFLLVDKPHGATSHDAVYAVRRALSIKRVGHSGTLDPAATGLLIVAVGPATRLLQYIDDEPKIYEGTIRLGVETTTQDAEGEIVATNDPSNVTDEQIAVAIKTLTGDIQQTPPMFSAVKVAGSPLYKAARRGETVERKTRSVTIHEFDADRVDSANVNFRVVCSGGTYVRTLAHDLGERLGVGAHLSRLRRTQMGSFRVADAIAPNDALESNLIDPVLMLSHIEQTSVDPETAVKLRNGVAVDLRAAGELTTCIDDVGLVCLARRSDGLWKPEVVVR